MYDDEEYNVMIQSGRVRKICSAGKMMIQQKNISAYAIVVMIASMCNAQTPKPSNETPAWPEKPPPQWLTYHLANTVR